MRRLYDPDMFEHRVDVLNLTIFAFTSDSDLIDDVKQIFNEEFRSINRKDPEFCYMCVCNEKYTKWTFGYYFEDLCDKAETQIFANMKLIGPTKIRSHAPYFEGIDCNCPIV